MRACLIGEACQRIAQLSAGEARIVALKQMAEAYESGVVGAGRLPAYAALMRAAALVALGAGANDPDVPAALAAIETALGVPDARESHFEPVATRAAAILVKALAAGEDMTAPAAAADVLYAAGWKRTGDIEALERSSDFLTFLSDMLPDSRKGAWLDGLTRKLDELAAS